MERRPSILFVISDTGGGHRGTANALDAAIGQISGPGTDRQIVDLLARSGLPLIRDAPDLWDSLSTRWVRVYDLLFQLTDGPRRIGALSRLAFALARRNVARVLGEARPDLVVSVHPLANRLISGARRSQRLPFRFAVVETELAAPHAAWGDPAADLCIAPTDESYARLRRLGVPEARLARTGYPVHPKFAAYGAGQGAARARLGLADGPLTVLVTGGGVGAGNLRELVLALDRAGPAWQILAVTGKNAALRAELGALGLRPGVRAYGFVSNMEELMAASDIVVTKAGPSTLMEALTMGRPVLVTGAAGIQERGNIDFVLRHRLGAFCPTVERVVAAVAELADPAAYAATAARLRAAVPRDGSAQIARMLLGLLPAAPPA